MKNYNSKSGLSFLYPRVVTSFFRFELIDDTSTEELSIMAPIIQQRTLDLTNKPKSNNILVYLSPQILRTKNLVHIGIYLNKYKDFNFHLFLPEGFQALDTGNLNFYPHHHPKFDKILGNCKGIISTAGHGLLSEAMFLNKPVLALPLDLYEQQMNAHVIHQNEFGLMSSPQDLQQETFDQFFNQLDFFHQNVLNDKKILLRNTNADEFIQRLMSFA